MQSFLPDFPHLRSAPPHVLRGLREVDPTADLVYVGWGRWQVVTVAEHSRRTAAGAAKRDSCLRLLHKWETDPKLRANPGAGRALMLRYRTALLTYFGACLFGEQYRGEPTSVIVDDFRRADWLFRTLSDQDVDEAVHAPHEQAREASRADLTDPARARAAWHWQFNISHGPASQRSQVDRVRSGFVRHPSPSGVQ